MYHYSFLSQYGFQAETRTGLLVANVCFMQFYYFIFSLSCARLRFCTDGYMVSMEKQIQDQQVKFWMQWIGSCNVMGFDDGWRDNSLPGNCRRIGKILSHKFSS